MFGGELAFSSTSGSGFSGGFCRVENGLGFYLSSLINKKRTENQEEKGKKKSQTENVAPRKHCRLISPHCFSS